MGRDKKKMLKSESSSSSDRSGSDGEIESTASTLPPVSVKQIKTKRKHCSSSGSSSESDDYSSTHRQKKKSKSKEQRKEQSKEEDEEPPAKRKKPKLDKQQEKLLAMDHITHNTNNVIPLSVEHHQTASFPLSPMNAKMNEPKEIGCKNNSSDSSLFCDMQSSVLFAEVICEFADFATCIAQKIANRAEYHWTPRILREAKASGKAKEPKDPNEPRRPLSSYTLWSNHIRKITKKEQPDRPPLKMSDLSELWKQVPTEQKARWEEAAKAERYQYNKEVEIYNLQKSRISPTNDSTKKAAANSNCPSRLAGDRFNTGM